MERKRVVILGAAGSGRREVLADLLERQDHLDFGRDILPSSLESHRVAAYLFDDYWEDIGTIKAFYEANLHLCDDEPRFRFYVPEAPIYTRARFLPPSSFRDAHVERSLVAEGSLLDLSGVGAPPLGLFIDDGILDTHLATIDWGDGTAAQNAVVFFANGSGALGGTHIYADDGLYTVTVAVTDDDTQALVLSQNALALDEGANGSINVSLAFQPTGIVTVNTLPRPGPSL